VKPVVCAIGTTEPWSAAGLGLDVRALAELGAHPLLVVAAVSAQDAGGVRALHPVPLDVLRAQLAALRGAPVAAYRVGALPTVAVAREVAATLAAAAVPSVYDPALRATGGGELAGEDAVAVAWEVIPYAAVVTPNTSEAERLLARPVRDLEAMRGAARELAARGARAVVLTGGHLPGEPRDVLFADGELREFAAPRIDAELRGTGCLFADALAVALARGATLAAAVETARRYVRDKLSSGIPLGGMRVAD